VQVRYVGGTWRVGGLLALSRAFGDAYLKGPGQFEGVSFYANDSYSSGFGGQFSFCFLSCSGCCLLPSAALGDAPAPLLPGHTPCLSRGLRVPAQPWWLP
jgi:hypothetical protein